jgi:hypothetical protein
MNAELRVTFLGEHLDAHKALAGLNKLLQVLAAAEGIGNRGAKRISWQFAHLGVGSVEAGIVPLELPPGHEVQAAFAHIVDGFAEAEEREGVPAGWTEDLARYARDLIGDADVEGLILEMRRDGKADRRVRATRTARNHLDAGLRQGHRESIGSLIGHLDSIHVHDRYEARLWPDRGGPPVLIRFDSDLVEHVKDHLGTRVEASGRIRRDGAGNVVSLKLKDLERLADFDDSPPLSDLVGLDPNFTGGKTAVEYLREIRGEAR